jgi:hypothetical protein
MGRLSLLALALLTLAADDAAASPIAWSYKAVPDTPAVLADEPGTSAVLFSSEASGPLPGNASPLLTTLTTVSVAKEGAPDVFTAAPYGIALEITDIASGQKGTLHLTGQLTGTLSETKSDFTNLFSGNLVQSVVLGDNRYSVTVGQFKSPGPPQGGLPGTIHATAEVSVEAVGVPEPATLTLVGLGAACAAARYAWRRPRRRPGALVV